MSKGQEKTKISSRYITFFSELTLVFKTMVGIETCDSKLTIIAMSFYLFIAILSAKISSVDRA